MHAKPYNAILGEVFRCKYYHEDSVSIFISEQVSHHPPVSATLLVNKERNISLQYVEQVLFYTT